MNANTPIHEYGHLWIDFVKKHNNPLYKRIVYAAAQSEFYKELKANPAYAHLSHTERAEEATARAIADAGEVRFLNERGLEKFKQFLRELWEWVAERLGLSGRDGFSGMDAEDVGNLTLVEIAEGGARELLGGREIGEAENDGAGGENYISGDDSLIEGWQEVAKKAEMYQMGMSREEARARLFERIGPQRIIMIQNENDGDVARLNTKSIGKLTASETVRKSVDNGFTKEQHYAVASDIDNLYRNAVKVWSHPDTHGHNDVFIHRFAIPLHFDNAVAYITVKESTVHGKKIHSAELMEIKKLGGILEEARRVSRALPNSELPLEGGGMLAYAGKSLPRDARALGLYTDNIRKLRENVNSKIKKK
jgi:hypothetical protein